MKSLSQKRADFALKTVLDFFKALDNNKDAKTEFKRFAAGTPAMILQNGFGLTMTFFLGKNEKKHHKIYTSIKEWVTKQCETTKDLFRPEANDEAFLRALNDLEQRDYLTVQTEAVKILEWIKRYAAAFVEE